jgi:hypothetical protein
MVAYNKIDDLLTSWTSSGPSTVSYPTFSTFRGLGPKNLQILTYIYILTLFLRKNSSENAELPFFVPAAADKQKPDRYSRLNVDNHHEP